MRLWVSRAALSLACLCVPALLFGVACGAKGDHPPACSTCGIVDGPDLGGAPSNGSGGEPSESGSGGGGSDMMGAAACDGLGSPMVEIEGLDGEASFCMDVREATNGDFKLFAEREIPKLTEPCGEINPELVGQGVWHDDDDADLPLASVDYCSALAFCQWAGKRLCGEIGTGAVVANADVTDPAVDEWSQVCTNGGATLYPYGDEFNEDTCNSFYPGRAPKESGTFEDCHGTMNPYDQIFDMAGNVWEWTNNCEADGPATLDDLCVMRGGEAEFGLMLAEDESRCDYTGFVIERGFAQDSAGIRCCKSLE
jgi:formylglycine-generating enzyme